MQNIQRLLNTLQAENGDAAILTEDYRLLRRYLNEHRRDFYRTFNATKALRKSKDQPRQQAIDNKIRLFAADTNRPGAIVKAYETDYFHANAEQVKDFNRMIDDPKPAAATR